MSFFLTAGGALLGFFLFSYFRAGRFGATVLAFGVGYLLATMWAESLKTYESIYLPGVSLRDSSFALLVVIPGLLAMLCSPKQKSLLPKIVQAFMIAVFGVALLLPILGTGGGHVSELYKVMEQNRDLIISGIVVIGLFDMVLSRSEKPAKHKEH